PLVAPVPYTTLFRSHVLAQLDRDHVPRLVGLAAVGGLQGELADPLQHVRDALERRLLEAQAVLRHGGVAVVLPELRQRLAHAERARGGDRVIRRRQQAPAGRQLALRTVDRGLQPEHHLEALPERAAGGDTRHRLPVAASRVSNSVRATLTTCAEAW